MSTLQIKILICNIDTFLISRGIDPVLNLEPGQEDISTTRLRDCMNRLDLQNGICDWGFGYPPPETERISCNNTIMIEYYKKQVVRINAIGKYIHKLGKEVPDYIDIFSYPNVTVTELRDTLLRLAYEDFIRWRDALARLFNGSYSISTEEFITLEFTNSQPTVVVLRNLPNLLMELGIRPETYFPSMREVLSIDTDILRIGLGKLSRDGFIRRDNVKIEGIPLGEIIDQEVDISDRISLQFLKNNQRYEARPKTGCKSIW